MKIFVSFPSDLKHDVNQYTLEDYFFTNKGFSRAPWDKDAEGNYIFVYTQNQIDGVDQINSKVAHLIETCDIFFMFASTAYSLSRACMNELNHLKNKTRFLDYREKLRVIQCDNESAKWIKEVIVAPETGPGSDKPNSSFWFRTDFLDNEYSRLQPLVLSLGGGQSTSNIAIVAEYQKWWNAWPAQVISARATIRENMNREENPIARRVEDSPAVSAEQVFALLHPILDTHDGILEPQFEALNGALADDEVSTHFWRGGWLKNPELRTGNPSLTDIFVQLVNAEDFKISRELPDEAPARIARVVPSGTGLTTPKSFFIWLPRDLSGERQPPALAPAELSSAQVGVPPNPAAILPHLVDGPAAAVAALIRPLLAATDNTAIMAYELPEREIAAAAVRASMLRIKGALAQANEVSFRRIEEMPNRLRGVVPALISISDTSIVWRKDPSSQFQGKIKSVEEYLQTVGAANEPGQPPRRTLRVVIVTRSSLPPTLAPPPNDAPWTEFPIRHTSANWIALRLHDGEPNTADLANATAELCKLFAAAA
jgi:hypothetical protein